MEGRIPVTVVTGFLGAGKSTLVERWLQELPRDETAVIVNEQGDVGIDGALLANRASRLREITGGCICCQTQAALEAALVELATSSPPPGRILVETSGAASPSGVIRALTRGQAREHLRLDGIVTVIDASRAEQKLRFPLTVEQLGFADVVVLSQIDRCSPTELRAAEMSIVPHAPGAVLARSERGHLQDDDTSVALLDLLARRSRVLRILPAEASQVARHGFDVVSLVHEGELDEARFGDWVESALGAVEARICRVKGILAIHGIDERVIVQGVGESIEVTLGAPWSDTHRTSRLVIIGLGLDEPPLQAGFARCFVDPPSG